MKKSKLTILSVLMLLFVLNGSAQSSGEICITLTLEQQKQINNYTYLDNSQSVCFKNRKELQSHLQ